MIFAIVHLESRWTATAVNHEAAGGCSVGLGQIYGSCHPKRIATLVDPRVNIQRVVSMLHGLETSCRTRCDGLGWLRGYNPGAPSYVRRVSGIVERCHDAHPSALRDVCPGMHLSHVPWSTSARASSQCGTSARRHRAA
ncbi:hypothetical protein [Pendulispora rubella]|uniref:hypothetical protein n=1 Tax=Pendulispora rubella TaxID=2741070 RepID=UPI00374E16BB